MLLKSKDFVTFWMSKNVVLLKHKHMPKKEPSHAHPPNWLRPLSTSLLDLERPSKDSAHRSEPRMASESWCKRNKRQQQQQHFRPDKQPVSLYFCVRINRQSNEHKWLLMHGAGTLHCRSAAKKKQNIYLTIIFPLQTNCGPF